MKMERRKNYEFHFIEVGYIEVYLLGIIIMERRVQYGFL